MKGKDKELEDNGVYRRKIWHESLDLVNKNLSNITCWVVFLSWKKQ